MPKTEGNKSVVSPYNTSPAQVSVHQVPEGTCGKAAFVASHVHSSFWAIFVFQ